MKKPWQKKYIALSLGFLTVLSFFVFSATLFVDVSSAQQQDFGVEEVGENIGLTGQDIRIVIAKIIRTALGLLGIIALGIILYAGFLWLTSAGNEDKIIQAKRLMINAAIGLAIILSAFTITQFLLNALGGGGGGEDVKPPPSCNPCTLGSACYNQTQCNAFCLLEENITNSFCKDAAFYVKSITPSTPSGDTKMNNIIVRALFSHPIAGGTDLSKALTLMSAGAGKPIQSNIKENGYLVEAVYDGADKQCVKTSDVASLPWKSPLSLYIPPQTLPYSIKTPQDSLPFLSVLPNNSFVNLKAPYTIDITLTLDAIPPKPASPPPGQTASAQLLFKQNSFWLTYNLSTESFCLLVAQKLQGTDGAQSNQICLPGKVIVGKKYHLFITQDSIKVTLFDDTTKSSTNSVDLLQNINPLFLGYPTSQYFAQFTVYDWKMLEGTALTQSQITALLGSNALCLPSGSYTTKVDTNIKDIYNSTLVSADPSFGGKTYPLDALFTASTIGMIDTVPPVIGDILVDGAANGMLKINNPYTLSTTIKDVTAAALFGGVAYAHLTITGPSGGKVIDWYTGPSVADGSSKDFVFQFKDTAWSDLFVPGQQYKATIEAFDIDNNKTVKSKFITATGPNCDQFGGGSGPGCIPLGTNCKSDAACSLDAKCIDVEESDLCVPESEECICVAWPTITSIDPLNGASGNWITIKGAHFGDTAGAIDWGKDTNNDGDVTGVDPEAYLIVGAIAECTADVWRDNWIIAEVPNDTSLALQSKSAIQVTIADAEKPIDLSALVMKDASVDEHGPIIDLFEKNDIKRPGLCVVQTADLQTAALPDTAVTAIGSGFGDTEGASTIKFGGVQGSVQTADWTNTAIETSVPGTLDPGEIGVVVNVANENSNSVPFTVLKETGDLDPVISLIDPANSTPKSYITIYGKGFGTSGHVYLANSKQVAVDCAQTKAGGDDPNTAACFEFGQSFPLQCTKTWTDTQVIVEVPDQSVASYSLVLINQAGFYTDGNNTFEIQTGGPRPSICELKPAFGPAPILNTSGKLSIFGKNFKPAAADPTIYFWKQGAEANTLSTWLSATFNTWVPTDPTVLSDVVPGFQGTQDLAPWTDGALQTLIPVASSANGGYTMKKGPIRVKGANGQESNSLNYEVGACSKASTAEKNLYNQSYHCCTEGADADQWKLNAVACDGEVREAGYVWRFTTGKIPVYPAVIENCDIKNWNVAGQTPPYPSPIPWEGHDPNTPACINGTVAVRFTKGMDPDSLKNKIKVYTCGTGDAIDCNTPIEILLTNSEGVDEWEYVSSLQLLKIMKGDVTTNILTPNTWYRVELLNGILSAKEDLGPGKEAYQAPLVKADPLHCEDPVNGNSTVYCYEFKTGGQSCVLTSAGIQPPNKTVTYLGYLLEQAYENDPVLELKGIFDKTQFIDLNMLFVYLIMGQSDKACNVLEVSGMGWNWATNSTIQATAEKLSDAGTKKNDDKAHVIALENTAPGFVQIQASAPFKLQENQNVDGADTASKSQTINAAPADLTIDLSNPGVSYFEPNCAEACVNGGILVTFDTYMDQSTYSLGFYVFACEDAVCDTLTDVTNLFELPENLQTPFTLRALLKNSNFLASGTYYKVSLNGENVTKTEVTVGKKPGSINGQLGIMSAGSKKDLTKVGKQLPPKEWVFKTQNSATPCAVGSLDVKPNPFTANIIGEKTLYEVLPKANPGVCSKDGQILNKWDYGYSWSTADGTVATVTNFGTPGISKSYCSNSCLLNGSDIPTTIASSLYLCGDGKLDPGEDCDPPGENNCEVNCVYTSGKLTTEELTGSQPYSAFDPNLVGASWCGDGFVTKGEACDSAISLAQAGGQPGKSNIGCSNNCLHTGSVVQSFACEVLGDPATLCANAVSVCGNKELEIGEGCEVVSDGGAVIYRTFTGPTDTIGEEATVTVSNANTLCNASCLLTNVCGTALAECVKDTSGCSSSCRFNGSTLLASVPSLCGDTIVGIGEYPACEVAESPTDLPGNNPLQIVTAEGNGIVNSETKKQNTFINVALDTWYTSTTKATVPPGQGAYALQCGYTEFVSPSASTGEYNDCPNNPDNVFGVGTNSCCLNRPVRTDEYPMDGAGFSGSDSPNPVCRNTAIKVTFNGEIDESSLTQPGNFVVVDGHPNGFACESIGEKNVSDLVSSLLAYQGGLEGDAGFFARVWQWIKGFFVRIFGGNVFASAYKTQVTSLSVWCSGSVAALPEITKTTDASNAVTQTTVSIAINKTLAPSTVYGVVLNGDIGGIANTSGVLIKSPDSSSRDDIWLFETGDDICKIKDVTVDPSSYLFTKPDAISSFFAEVHSQNEQLIQSTAGYSWEWSWGPHNDPLFTIPDTSNPSYPLESSDHIMISSNNLEGHATGFANATVTEDIDAVNNHKGKIFSGTTELYAQFCEKPWPALESDGSWSPWIQETYQMSMWYCSDAGVGGVVSDDLPYLVEVPPESIADPLSLKKYLFFNQQNTDVIGLQVFANPDRLSPLAWLQKKKGFAVTGFQSLDIDGYEAITDGENYYINALNKSGTVWFTNIYLLSINDGAQSSTKTVFDSLINSLEFNLNIPEVPYCGATMLDPDVTESKGCESDLECVGKQKTETLKEQKNGVCSVGSDGTWQEILVGSNETLQDIHIIGDKIWIAGDALTMMYSGDSGKNWTKQSVPGENIAGLSGLDFVDENNGWAVGSSGFIVQTKKGGAVWETLTKIPPNTPTLNAIDMANATEGWAVGYTGTILKTTNGSTWKKQTSGVTNRLNDVIFISPTIGWVVGGSGTILKTINGGAEWNKQTSGTTENIYGIFFLDENNGWAVGSNGMILQTTNGGTAWSIKNTLEEGKVNSNMVFNDVVFQNANTGWVVGGFGKNSIGLSTNNGGQTWKQFSLSPPNTTNNDLLDIALTTDGVWTVGESGLVFTTANLVSCSSNAACVSPNTCVDYQTEEKKTTDLSVCGNARTKLKRDWKRVNHIRLTQQIFASYFGQNDSYPDLKSGTFIPFYTNSRWPSWGYLGTQIKTPLPLDPLNHWSDCEPSDKQTCWDEKTSLFYCPAYTSIYEYTYNQPDSSYLLHVPMEFFVQADLDQFSSFTGVGGGNFDSGYGNIDGKVGVTSGDSSCMAQVILSQSTPSAPPACLNGSIAKADLNCDGTITSVDQAIVVALATNIPLNQAVDKNTNNVADACEKQNFYTLIPTCQGQTQSPFAGSCGDGNVNLGESCDPPNKTQVYGSCGKGTYTIGTCNTECKETIQCTSLASCGNAKVEIGEDCDFGSKKNGTYGTNCSASCTYSATVASCGDGAIQAPIEYCEKVSDIQAVVQVTDAKNIQKYGHLSCTPFLATFVNEYISKELCSGDNACVLGTVLSFAPLVKTASLCASATGYCSGNKQLLCAEDADCSKGPISINPVIKITKNNVATILDGTVLTSSVSSYGTCVKNKAYGASYNFYKKNTCSWDCTTNGGYCGDGIAQPPSEICDDGNTTDFDGCSSVCLKENIACKSLNPNIIVDATAKTTQIVLGKGNYNTLNNFQGEPLGACVTNTTGDDICRAYGLACKTMMNANTANASNCNQNLSDSPSAQNQSTNAKSALCYGIYNGPIALPPSSGTCGNKTIDADKGETCDLGDQNGIACSPEYGKSCTYCADDCSTTLTVDPIAYCGNKIVESESGEKCDIDGTNVVIKKQQNSQVLDYSCADVFQEDGDQTTDPQYAKGKTSCDNQCTLFNKTQCILCGEKQGGHVPELALMNVMVGDNVAGDGGWKNDKKKILYKANNAGVTANIAEDMSIGDAFMKYSPWVGDDNWKKYKGIESNAACFASYKVRFSTAGSETYASDYFDYPLTVFGNTVRNDYALSPAVPPGYARVVLRWASTDGDYTMLGNLFNPLFQNEDGTVQGGTAPLSYLEAKKDNKICDAIETETISGHTFWTPKSCGSYTYGVKPKSVYVHPFGKTPNLRAQAFTVKVADLANGDKIAFFVQDLQKPKGIQGDVLSPTIKADVYLPKGNFTNQTENSTKLTTYLPTKTFAITESAGTSSNASASYWYAFNIVKKSDTISIEPVQKIVTDFEGILTEYAN